MQLANLLVGCIFICFPPTEKIRKDRFAVWQIASVRGTVAKVGCVSAALPPSELLRRAKNATCQFIGGLHFYLLSPDGEDSNELAIFKVQLAIKVRLCRVIYG